jgi:hypothetical protein
VRHGDPGCQQHNHTTVGGHSSASNRANGLAAHHRSATRKWAPSEQLQVYQEEQQARAYARQADTERRATQQRRELIGERVAIEAQLVKLHHHKSMLETKRAIMIDLTNARAQARDVAATNNSKGAQRPAFTRANQNVAATAALLDTLPTPSTSGADKVYHQLKNILTITTVLQVESSLQC